MYSFPNFEPLHCNMCSSKCCFLTCTQIYQESGKVVSYSHHFKNCLHFILIHIVKSFSVCSKWSRSRFLLELPCVLYDPRNVGNLISGSCSYMRLPAILEQSGKRGPRWSVRFNVSEYSSFLWKRKKVSSNTGNYKPRPHTISPLLILNYALAS